jgi:hypothetical protein
LFAAHRPTGSSVRVERCREKLLSGRGQGSGSWTVPRTNRETGRSGVLHGNPDEGVWRMELRQLHYIVTLVGELHFGRAAAREHIVQSR